MANINNEIKNRVTKSTKKIIESNSDSININKYIHELNVLLIDEDEIDNILIQSTQSYFWDIGGGLKEKKTIELIENLRKEFRKTINNHNVPYNPNIVIQERLVKIEMSEMSRAILKNTDMQKIQKKPIVIDNTKTNIIESKIKVKSAQEIDFEMKMKAVSSNGSSATYKQNKGDENVNENENNILTKDECKQIKAIFETIVINELGNTFDSIQKGYNNYSDGLIKYQKIINLLNEKKLNALQQKTMNYCNDTLESIQLRCKKNQNNMHQFRADEQKDSIFKKLQIIKRSIENLVKFN